MKYSHGALIAALILVGTAQAQPAYTEVEDGLFVVDPLGMTVEELTDARVYTESGDPVGELDDVLMAQDDETIAISLDVGGFLGVGEKDVLVPADKLSAQADGLKLDMSKAEIDALPEYKD